MTNKEQTLRNYKEAKENFLKNKNDETWKRFCEAKRNCMLLGIRL